MSHPWAPRPPVHVAACEACGRTDMPLVCVRPITAGLTLGIAKALCLACAATSTPGLAPTERA